MTDELDRETPTFQTAVWQAALAGPLHDVGKIELVWLK